MSQVNIEPLHEKAVSLSNRQFSLLTYIHKTRSRTLTIDEIASLNQLTLGSLARPARAYLKPNKTKDGLELTPKGERALRAFQDGNFFRTVQSFHFSSFVHLKVPPGHEPPQRRSAAA